MAMSALHLKQGLASLSSKKLILSQTRSINWHNTSSLKRTTSLSWSSVLRCSILPTATSSFAENRKARGTTHTPGRLSTDSGVRKGDVNSLRSAASALGRKNQVVVSALHLPDSIVVGSNANELEPVTYEDANGVLRNVTLGIGPETNTSTPSEQRTRKKKRSVAEIRAQALGVPLQPESKPKQVKKAVNSKANKEGSKKRGKRKEVKTRSNETVGPENLEGVSIGGLLKKGRKLLDFGRAKTAEVYLRECIQRGAEGKGLLDALLGLAEALCAQSSYGEWCAD